MLQSTTVQGTDSSLVQLCWITDNLWRNGECSVLGEMLKAKVWVRCVRKPSSLLPATEDLLPDSLSGASLISLFVKEQQ